jgi:hypothetical protein
MLHGAVFKKQFLAPVALSPGPLLMLSINYPYTSPVRLSHIYGYFGDVILARFHFYFIFYFLEV